MGSDFALVYNHLSRKRNLRRGKNPKYKYEKRVFGVLYYREQRTQKVFAEGLTSRTQRKVALGEVCIWRGCSGYVNSFSA